MEIIGLMSRLPVDLRDWLADEAKKEERSMNWMLVSILKEKRAAQAAQKEKTLIAAGKH
ncbi:hypothetical protein [Janthinobacterium sp. LB2P10]|uniref:hypothetical protein n=1 Tax=Janthinobacterium sp. LB2P10 TaxID=3424194 RepID=UPI003F26B614